MPKLAKHKRVVYSTHRTDAYTQIMEARTHPAIIRLFAERQKWVSLLVLYTYDSIFPPPPRAPGLGVGKPKPPKRQHLSMAALFKAPGRGEGVDI